VKYRYVLALSCSIALLFGLQFSSASSALQVNETTTKVLIKGERLVVALAVNNLSDKAVAAHVKLEIIDPQNQVRALVERDVTIKQGPSTLDIPLPVSISNKELPDLLWHRLRYRINPGPVEGLVSLSEITPDIFQLGIIKPMATLAGTRYSVKVRAAHPVSSHPMSGVNVEATIKFDEQKQSSAVTDSEGYATFDFDLPRDIKTNEGNVKVTGQRNGLRAEVESGIRVDRAPRITISSDKALYQPGQTLHIRALALSPLRRAIAGAEFKLKIIDSEDAIVYRATIKSSRFGVMKADWVIPENMRLGDYTIQIDSDEDDYAYTNPQKVRISRYELPNFTVNIRPDRGYYLPDQNAEVEVVGNYLFGQSLTQGRVRIVRETEREWNYREQKWEIEEEDSFEGELDKTGRFLARIDLKKEYEALAENEYRQFRDISYAAYVTDPSTNRTEQRRFDLRVTKEPIHVYVISEDNQSATEPLQFYVSTFYADGTPAECEVAIRESASTDYGKNGKSRASGGQILKSIKTNRYGLAKVKIRQAERKASYANDDATLNFLARDGKGQSGHHSESLSVSSSSWVRVDTDKTIYRAGEPVRAQLRASKADAQVFVDIMQDRKMIRSELIKLNNGRAAFTLPYNAECRGEVTIVAYSYTDEDSLPFTSRSVLYPRDQELKLDLRMGAATYRPGDEASADFKVRTADNRAVESALGITIFDRAVEERTRTDSDFGAQPFFYRGWYHDNALAGISRGDLDKLDLSKPIPDDLDLVAEILLFRPGYYPDHTTGNGYYLSQHKAFDRLIAAQMDPIKNALDSRYARKAEYPANARRLALELASAGIDFVEMRDPWGTPYRALFSVRNEQDVMNLMSAGADKRFDTDDDLRVVEKSWPYFHTQGKAIDRAIEQYYKRTGGFIRDRATLGRELLKTGIDIASLRDRWGKPYDYRFGVSGMHYTLNIVSGGANGRLDTKADYGSGDFTIWTAKSDYFDAMRAGIDAALNAYFNASGRFPQDEAELSKALGQAGIEWGNLLDPWGHRYYATFKSQMRYNNPATLINYSRYPEGTKPPTEITPGIQLVSFIYVRSAGEDGKPNTSDDFVLADYLRIVAERSTKDAVAQLARAASLFSGETGVIGGVVTDPQGAIIPMVAVKATNKTSLLVYTSQSDDEGRYLLVNLPSGLYDMQFESPGFKITVLTNVSVRSTNITEINISLDLGGKSEMVTVTASAVGTQTQQITTRQVGELPLNGRQFAEAVTKSGAASSKQLTQISTPRLRQYFPETLVWQPSLETDSEGHARLNFKFADNITTWKVLAVASTIDGEIGTVEKDVLAFQPFFIEHDPPRVLTQGDEVSLPVVLRNYLDKPQTVDVEIKPEQWFEVTGSARKRILAAPAEAARAVFDFRATAVVKEGQQRVTASSDSTSDAVEKRVEVYPDGEEITETASRVFGDAATIDVNIPSNAIKDTARAELKIYPNLMAHVVESIEGIMQRPYGCAEQTISSAYPSLLLLRYYKQHGEDFPPIAERARRYAQAGYERLLNYGHEQGGFSYWGRGDQDLALTAYALRFLNDAREFVAVDEKVIARARDWLVKQQRADGSWGAHYGNTREDGKSAALLTAFIARVLAIKANNERKDSTAANLKRALDYLAQRVEEINEPYLIASYALAAIDANEPDRAAKATGRLRSLARHEADADYWSLETGTPFYGWGLTGRVETTALAVQAMALAARKEQQGGKDSEESINRGLIYLLRQKDRYGVWHSTQATINVLDALMVVLSSRAQNRGTIKTDREAEIIINGKRATGVAMPPGNQLSNPLAIDISSFLSTGNNRVEIRRAAGSEQVTAQIVATHYAPWPASADRKEATGALRLRVSFDKTELRVGEDVTCDVRAERVDVNGYGMMLAEIGLPPGADVDRASLDRAMKESDWGLDRYDVLPDKLVVYLWPRAHETRFLFKFKPRFGIKARTAPSVIYDYYNPEARAVVAPTKFVVY
jgi:uncharacterized protein YfaS (alpha-2-macroglobulin family)